MMEDEGDEDDGKGNSFLSSFLWPLSLCLSVSFLSLRPVLLWGVGKYRTSFG